MENNSQPPFHVWQRVVAIKNHSTGLFKKGDEYTVLDLIQCLCGKWSFYCGRNVRQGTGMDCRVCNKAINADFRMLFACDSFAPYNPPRQVEIAEDILKMGIVEERADVAPERVLND